MRQVGSKDVNNFIPQIRVQFSKYKKGKLNGRSLRYQLSSQQGSVSKFGGPPKSVFSFWPSFESQQKPSEAELLIQPAVRSRDLADTALAAALS